MRVRGAPKTDLLAPAERRFANFVFAIFRLGANAGARAFAAKLVPGARWIFRPTRWRRLLAAVADSLFLGWGRTLEFGRSGCTLMMMRPAGRSATGYRQNRRH